MITIIELRKKSEKGKNKKNIYKKENEKVRKVGKN